MAGLMRFVPHAEPVPHSLIQRVQTLIDQSKRGYFCDFDVCLQDCLPSQTSRTIGGERVGQFARTSDRPVQHHEFMTSEYRRRRYWARNFVANPRFSAAPCNLSHLILSQWEQSDKFQWLITQNVDGLHIKAGSKRITELHGAARYVICMDCKRQYPRAEIQNMIDELNPNWTVDQVGELAPDGDVNIPDEALVNFRVPYCTSCGERSILKTDVVFFGDNVPRKAVDQCYEHIEQSDLLMVFGSSLTVMSGFRFVYFAALRSQPIVIVNIGQTRGDDLAAIKVSGKCSEVLKSLQLN